jgi:hypothetical protein
MGTLLERPSGLSLTIFISGAITNSSVNYVTRGRNAIRGDPGVRSLSLRRRSSAFLPYATARQRNAKRDVMAWVRDTASRPFAPGADEFNVVRYC